MSATPEIRFDALCRAARALLGAAAARVQVEGDAGFWLDLAPDLDAAVWRAALAPTATAPQPERIAEVRFGPGGCGRLELFHTCPHAPAPAPAAETLASLRDLAELAGECLRWWHEARAAAAREAEFRLLAETTTDTIVRGSLDGVRLYVSPSVQTLLGYEPQELLGRRASELTHPEDLSEFQALMKAVSEGRLDVGLSEQRQRHKNGSWVWLEASVRLTRDPVTGSADGYVASVRGIGRRKALEARLHDLASYDALTGLPNRVTFGRKLAQAVQRLLQDGQTFVLLYMDIDHFKQVNDGLGHAAGDAMLVEAADRFRSVLRASDSVARLGGDEFTVILELAPAAAARLAQRLIDAIARPFDGVPSAFKVGLSVGIARAGVDGDDEASLLAAADRALYAAKHAGRGAWRFASG